MGRPLRVTAGGLVHHVLNRASGRGALFEGVADYQQFEHVLAEARARVGMRILAYCVMPNHWHLVLWPERDGDLTRFMTWLSLTHTQRWHAHRGTAGSGHVYQGRYKAFLVQTDEHLLTACRYVERNPLRARLVRRAERWRWGSLWRRERAEARRDDLLADWPVPRPPDWCAFVNQAQSAAELGELRLAVNRGRPLGDPRWIDAMAGPIRPGLDIAAARPPQAPLERFLTPFLLFL